MFSLGHHQNFQVVSISSKSKASAGPGISITTIYILMLAYMMMVVINFEVREKCIRLSMVGMAIICCLQGALPLSMLSSTTPAITADRAIILLLALRLGSSYSFFSPSPTRHRTQACIMLFIAHIEGLENSWMVSLDWKDFVTAPQPQQWYCAVYWVITTVSPWGHCMRALRLHVAQGLPMLGPVNAYMVL